MGKRSDVYIFGEIFFGGISWHSVGEEFSFRSLRKEA
jgi:hypothetical protein